MKPPILLRFIFLAGLIFSLIPSSKVTGAFSQEIAVGSETGSMNHAGPIISDPVTPTLSQPVRDLPTGMPEMNEWTAPNRHNPSPELAPTNLSEPESPLVERGLNVRGLSPAPLLSFEGVGNAANVSPPDPNGDVGPNHYVQMVSGGET